MAELADARASRARGRNSMRVRVSPRAHKKTQNSKFKSQNYKSKVKTLIISSHCEPRPFVKTNFNLEKTKFSAIKKFICFLIQSLTKGRGEAIPLNEL